MPYKISFGPIDLSLTLLKRPLTNRVAIALTALVSTPFSSATVENVICDFGDLLVFRRRLHRFIKGDDEGAVAMHVLMPMFDLALITTLQGTVRSEVRLSSDVRYERHVYDFESTFEEVAEFARMLDYALVSLPLGTTTVA